MAYEGLVGPGVGVGSSGGSSNANAVSVSFTRGSIKYDSPFLDMTSTFLPKNIKSILQFVSAYVLGDGLVAQCVSKMSEYPITKLLYNDEEASAIKDDKTIEKWKDILEGQLQIMKTLKQAGMDYYSYGNSVISINYPFKRMLQCPRCKKRHSADGVKYKFKSFEFYANCPEDGCGYKGKMTANDINTSEVKKLSIVHWDLIYLHIKYNSITGEHFYFYTIPMDLASAIRRGDMDIIRGTRLEVIRAVREKKQLKLMADNVFHLKRPAPQYLYPSERGWGIPVIMPVMKDIFHCKVLKKGNEMIAFDHIVPLRIMFPQGTGDVSPHATINLSTWKTKIEDELRKWRADPNYVAIVPIPVGIQNFGGDAKILSVSPEIKQTEDAIITGIGVIPEIIRGGASWSGSNVSLRVVENTFLNHRNDIHELLDFIIDKVQRLFKLAKISVKMSDFKMADDLEKKRLMIGAAQGPASEALISRKTAVKELGFDPEEEYRNQTDELQKRLELMVQEAEGQAEAQGAGSVINAQYQADAQMANQERMDAAQRDLQGKKDEESMIQKEDNAMGVQDEVAALAERSGKSSQGIPVPNLILILTYRFARLAKVNPEEYKIRMLAMKNSTPMLYQEVYNNLKEMNLIQADTQPDLAEAQKSTPGEIPTFNQGDNFAGEEPSPVEVGADPMGKGVFQPGNPLPEVRPPMSKTAPV
jgi:hypothetical protein